MAHIVDEMVAEVRRKVTGPDGSSADVDVTSRHIDVDAEPDVADAAAADRLPLLTLHVNTNEVLRLVGARPKRELREQVSAVLHKWWQD